MFLTQGDLEKSFVTYDRHKHHNVNTFGHEWTEISKFICVSSYLTSDLT